jgi:AcrR family transcriptional regulator
MAGKRSSAAKRVRMDHEERRRQLLHAAAQLFLRRPYSEVSITDIAEQAGVARGLLHHYFESKRDLYLAVVREVTDVRVPVEGEAAADVDPLPAAIDALLGYVADNQTLWLNSLSVGGPERDDELAGIVDASREVLAEQTIAALGLPDTDVARAVVRGYGGLVQEVTLEWLQRGRLTREQARTVLVRALPLLVEEVLPALGPDADLRP